MARLRKQRGVLSETRDASSVSSKAKALDEPIAGSCFRWDKDGNKREFTAEEYAATPRGHIFIGIGGFKPPTGKTDRIDPIPQKSDPEE